MKNAMLNALDNALETRNMADLVDVNDWAVNELRDWTGTRAEYDTRDGECNPAETMVREEYQRIVGGNLDFDAYVKTRRTGSRFRLSRIARVYVYAIVRTRRALTGRT